MADHHWHRVEGPDTSFIRWGPDPVAGPTNARVHKVKCCRCGGESWHWMVMQDVSVDAGCGPHVTVEPGTVHTVRVGNDFTGDPPGLPDEEAESCP